MDEKTKELARLSGFIVEVSDNADRQIEQFATLIRQDEREACALIASKEAQQWEYPSHANAAAVSIADAIRARMK